MEKSKTIDGKKFMWDGMEYKDENEARSALEKYESDGFEARRVAEDDKFYVFTRRVATEVKVEGAPTGS
jgi:hypothetical protein